MADICSVSSTSDHIGVLHIHEHFLRDERDNWSLHMDRIRYHLYTDSTIGLHALRMGDQWFTDKLNLNCLSTIFSNFNS